MKLLNTLRCKLRGHSWKMIYSNWYRRPLCIHRDVLFRCSTCGVETQQNRWAFDPHVDSGSLTYFFGRSDWVAEHELGSLGAIRITSMRIPQ